MSSINVLDIKLFNPVTLMLMPIIVYTVGDS
jgi:hypothetical protein